MGEANKFTDREIEIDLEIRQAIQLRLVLRDRLLSAVESDLSGDQADRIRRWEQCLELLPKLRDTWSFGVPVKEACSTKIQRRLASSMPPRPLVEISFEDAYTHLTHLCRNGTEVYRVLEYHGSTTLLVGCADILLKRI